MYNLYSIIINNNYYIVIAIQVIVLAFLKIFKVRNNNIMIIFIISLSATEWYYKISYFPFLIFINVGILFIYFLEGGVFFER